MAINPSVSFPVRDPAAELFERHGRAVYAFCLSRLGNRPDAEDAVQSTFLNAHRSMRAGVQPELESAWLFAIANRVVMNRRRADRRRRRVEAPRDLDDIAERVPGHHAQHDELLHLNDAVAALPEQQRRALLMREWQGLSYREIASLLQVSQGATEQLIFRARRRLARELESLQRRSSTIGLHVGSLILRLRDVILALMSNGRAVGAVVATVAAVSAGASGHHGAPAVGISPRSDDTTRFVRSATLLAPPPPHAAADTARSNVARSFSTVAAPRSEAAPPVPEPTAAVVAPAPETTAAGQPVAAPTAGTPAVADPVAADDSPAAPPVSSGPADEPPWRTLDANPRADGGAPPGLAVAAAATDHGGADASPPGLAVAAAATDHAHRADPAPPTEAPSPLPAAATDHAHRSDPGPPADVPSAPAAATAPVPGKSTTGPEQARPDPAPQGEPPPAHADASSDAPGPAPLPPEAAPAVAAHAQAPAAEPAPAAAAAATSDAGPAAPGQSDAPPNAGRPADVPSEAAPSGAAHGQAASVDPGPPPAPAPTQDPVAAPTAPAPTPDPVAAPTAPAPTPPPTVAPPAPPAHGAPPAKGKKS